MCICLYVCMYALDCVAVRMQRTPSLPPPKIPGSTPSHQTTPSNIRPDQLHPQQGLVGRVQEISDNWLNTRRGGSRELQLMTWPFYHVRLLCDGEGWG